VRLDGGEPRNRHGHKKGQGSSGKTDKTPIVALVSRETGEVRSRAVADVRGPTLRSVLDEHVDAAKTHLHTDMGGAYTTFAYEFAGHSAVDHKGGQYVNDDVSTNQAEAYFSQLKRSIDGTHHHVSREHLSRYLAHFDFLFSTRGMTDTERTIKAIGQTAGRRLTYREPARA
jgi:outer membrane translocation and assembly module TamA